ncbi:hypothetical protein Hdeb2414_s0006g00221651 [Helianthus debilis subsp. tardiflorus]
MSPTTHSLLSSLSKDPTLTIPSMTQHLSSKAGSTRQTSLKNQWVLTHWDPKTISQATMRWTWTKTLILPNLQPGPLLTPSRSLMGHLSMDHLTVVQTVIRRDSPNMIRCLPLLTTPRLSSSSRIPLRILVLSWSLHRHYHQFSSRLRSHRGEEDQTHGCPCEEECVSAPLNLRVAATTRHRPLHEDPQMGAPSNPVFEVDFAPVAPPPMGYDNPIPAYAGSAVYDPLSSRPTPTTIMWRLTHTRQRGTTMLSTLRGLMEHPGELDTQLLGTNNRHLLNLHISSRRNQN